MNRIFTILFIGVFFHATAQVPKPAPGQDRPIALMNGIVHTGTGERIENGIVTFEEGKITSVGDARVVKIDLTAYEVVNVSGMHLYPGLILTNSNLGLVDIGAVRATLDHTEVGDFTPNVRSLIAYNTDSEVIPTLRFNGVLLAQVVPRGGIMPGTSSVMALDGWNWEDAAYVVDEGVHLHWPEYMKQPQWDAGSTEWKKNAEYNETVQKIEQFLQDARSYADMGNPEEVNLKLESMRGIFKGSQQLYVHADGRREIIESVTMLERYGIPRIVLVGADDAWYVMDFLKERDVPVLLRGVHRLPGRDEEDVDMPYKLPFLLHTNGIKTGLTHRGEVHNARNLPFYAGTAAAYGLDREEALQLITLRPAEILGIDDVTGSLEHGKDANIIVSEGDLLDMRTSKIVYAFIKGRKLNLDGKQQLLYERYKEKYEGE